MAPGEKESAELCSGMLSIEASDPPGGGCSARAPNFDFSRRSTCKHHQLCLDDALMHDEF